MNKNKVYILKDRGILYIKGDDAKEFLQNLISNDLNKVNEKYTCFASLLTPQGKYLYDFIVVKHKKGFLLDCEKQNIDQLYNQLNLYKLRSKVEILNLSNEFVVAVVGKEVFYSHNNFKGVEGDTTKFIEDQFFLDPRHKDLGARLIVNLEKINLSLKKLGLESSNIEEYYEISSELGIPQIGTKQLQNNIFGIECNFEELNGIDFKKGCYVGQENTARIKLKDKLNKRLFPVKIISGKIKEDYFVKSNEIEIGKLLIKDKYPFALIKYKDKNFKFENQYRCGEATIEIKKPTWLNKI